MIDSSKKRNSLVGVEVLSPYVIERRSKTTCNDIFAANCVLHHFVLKLSYSLP